MRRVLVPLLLATLACTQAFAQTTGSVEGVVVNSVTGVGIPGVTVTVYMRQGGLYEATTEASGEFRIFAMKPGSYEVRFAKEGFAQNRKDPPQPYAIGQGKDPFHLRLSMTPQVSLSGRVVDGDGKPVTQVEVKILGRNSVPVSSDGTFVFEHVEPGSYTLLAVPKATAGAAEGAKVPVTTYYPDSVDTAGAQPVFVRGDADVSGSEIHLQTAEAYRIRGVVLDETSNPKGGVTVRLLPQATMQRGPKVVGFGEYITLVGPGSYTGAEDAQVIVSAADGTFEFSAVRSGEWQVAAVTTVSVESPDFFNSFRSGALSVIVGTRSVENLQIRLTGTFKMTGTVDWGALPSRGGIVTLTPVDGRAVPLRPGFIDPKGALTLEAVTSGRFLIVPQPGPGYYPVSLLLGGQEVLGKAVDLSSAAPPLHITYKAATASVHGTVENGGGATVLLIPSDVQTMGFGRLTTCKPDGTFDLNGVPPGDYFAAAFEGFQRNPSADSEWLAKVAAIGTRVSVAEATATVQLKSVRWPE